MSSENEMTTEKLVYNIRLSIRQKDILPRWRPDDVHSVDVDLCFNEIPTYRRIGKVAQQWYKFNLEGFDRDDKPELYEFNQAGDTKVTLSIDPFWEV